MDQVMDSTSDAFPSTPPIATPSGSGSGHLVLWETLLLVTLRIIFFLLCRHYVNSYLFSDLRSVIHEDATSTDPDSPDLDGIALEDAEQGYFSSSTSASGSTSNNLAANGGASSSSSSSLYKSGRNDNGSGAALLSPVRKTPTRRESVVAENMRVKQRNLLYPKLSTSLFCFSFSECTMLFTLVLFGEAVSIGTRTLHWSISLLALLSMIVFVIPLGLCFFLTHRTKATSVSRTIGFTLVPFGVYLFLFYRVGSYIASKVDVEEGTHTLGVVNDLLRRICVPGVILIASLSGGGAVSTAWEAFEWRSISSAEPVTESQILSAERSLYRARMEIHQRERALTLAESSASREATESASQSYLSRWTSSNPAKAQLASLKRELEALESLEGQMVVDIAVLRRRKELRELGRTVRGRLWLAAGWALSVYCTWRVFISCVNLIFGYSQKQHRRPHNDPTMDPSDAPAGTDVITSLLSRLALVLNIDLDIAAWSRLIGLVLIGSIILANMRNVLGSVSRVFKATSTGISASFMLLFLAQLMSLYFLTSLISLPSTPSESSALLLDTLPEFNVFSRLFDSVFLIAAAGVFSLRWVQRKLSVEDAVTGQYM